MHVALHHNLPKHEQLIVFAKIRLKKRERNGKKEKFAKRHRG